METTHLVSSNISCVPFLKVYKGPFSRVLSFSKTHILNKRVNYTCMCTPVASVYVCACIVAALVVIVMS